jgi:hypothetical protein
MLMVKSWVLRIFSETWCMYGMPMFVPFRLHWVFFEGASFYLKIVTKSLKKHGNEGN